MSANLGSTGGDAAAAGRRAWPRTVLGIRTSALLETLAFLLVALAGDAVLGSKDHFAQVSPHPFWIAVLLASTYYGMREGLAAAALASLALLVGNVPELRINEDAQSWWLRTVLQPLMWSTAALVLGEIKDTARRRYQALAEELQEAREQAESIAHANEQLHRRRQYLEAQIAGQACTVSSMYRAWRAIEKNSVGDVLVGVAELVQVAMRPDKYSLFLLNGDRLEAALNEGWGADDPHAREFAGSSTLLDAVVSERRFLLVVRPDDAEVLGPEGLLAGPLVNPDTSEVIGMLKIESLRFLDLHMTTAHNFRVLCEWIGAAVARAQRVEDLRREVKDVGIARRLEAKLARELGIDGLDEFGGDRAAVPARESPCGMLD